VPVAHEEVARGEKPGLHVAGVGVRRNECVDVRRHAAAAVANDNRAAADNYEGHWHVFADGAYARLEQRDRHVDNSPGRLHTAYVRIDEAEALTSRFVVLQRSSAK
jgi:hypothetical protein